VLIPKDSALANILLETVGWKPIDSDEVAAMFVRTPSPAELKVPQPTGQPTLQNSSH
jgi:hypothetical protein